jgi:hypothetical protein
VSLSWWEGLFVGIEVGTNAVPITTCQQGCIRTACLQIVDKLSTACSQLVARFLSSTDLLQVVPTTSYRPVIHQLVNKL